MLAELVGEGAIKLTALCETGGAAGAGNGGVCDATLGTGDDVGVVFSDNFTEWDLGVVARIGV